MTDKTPVVALISRDTGEIRAKAVTNVTAENLHAAISGEVEPKLTLRTRTATSATRGSPATTPVTSSLTTKPASTSVAT